MKNGEEVLGLKNLKGFDKSKIGGILGKMGFTPEYFGSQANPMAAWIKNQKATSQVAHMTQGQQMEFLLKQKYPKNISPNPSFSVSQSAGEFHGPMQPNLMKRLGSSWKSIDFTKNRNLSGVSEDFVSGIKKLREPVENFGSKIKEIGKMEVKIPSWLGGTRLGGLGGRLKSVGGKIAGSALSYGFSAYEGYQGFSDIYGKNKDYAAGNSKIGSAVGSAAGFYVGAAIGTAVGGPVGTYVGGAIGATTGGAVGDWAGNKITEAENYVVAGKKNRYWGTGIDMGVEQANSENLDFRLQNLNSKSKYATQKADISSQLKSLNEGRYLTEDGESTNNYDESNKGQMNDKWIPLGDKQRQVAKAGLTKTYSSLFGQETKDKNISKLIDQGVYTPDNESFSRENLDKGIGKLGENEISKRLRGIGNIDSRRSYEENFVKMLTPENIKKLDSSTSGKDKAYFQKEMLSASLRTNDPKQLQKLIDGGFDVNKIMQSFDKKSQDSINQRMQSYNLPKTSQGEKQGPENKDKEINQNFESFKTLQAGANDLIAAAKILSATGEFLTKGVGAATSSSVITLSPEAAALFSLITAKITGQPQPAKMRQGT